MELTQERRVWIEARLAVLRPIRTDLEATRDRLNGEIERLETAYSSITTKLSEHDDFRRRVGQALDPIDSSRFRGDNRNRKGDGVEGLKNRLVEQRDRHQENLDQIRSRITTREQDRDTAVTRLNTTNNEIWSLENELRWNIV